MKTYFQHINEGIHTTLSGMKLTLKHLWDAHRRRSNNNIAGSGYFNEQNGMVTLQYPFETMPIPDNGRYRLHNEMDDCIVCDKCAKVCPVDCIDIEPIKATGEVGKASDGSPIRLYAAKFDIDMAKCCYCGLCTTVCPTECLTMTKTFDYSEFDVRDMNYHYANLTPEQAEEKKVLYEQFIKEKEELKRQSAVSSQQPAAGSVPLGDEQLVTKTPTPKPAFRPTVKPSIPKPEEAQPSPQAPPIEGMEAKAKPVFAPKKPVTVQSTEAQSPVQETPIGGEGAKAKPVFAPKKPVTVQSTEAQSPVQEIPIGGAEAKAKPVFVPKKPVTAQSTEAQSPVQDTPIGGTEAKPKPVFAPKKPVTAQSTETQSPVQETPIGGEEAKPKPVFVPKKSVSTQPVISDELPGEDKTDKKEAPIGGMGTKPKPVFKPTMKPKKEE